MPRATNYATREAANIRAEARALEAVLLALLPLDFAARRRALRWVAERYGIDTTKLGTP